MRRILKILFCTFGLHWLRAVPGKRVGRGDREFIDRTRIRECAWCFRCWHREQHMIEVWVTEKEHARHVELRQSMGIGALVRSDCTQGIVLQEEDATRLLGTPQSDSS